MIQDQMAFMLLALCFITFALWVCFCDTPKQARIPLIGLLISVILIQMVGH